MFPKVTDTVVLASAENTKNHPLISDVDSALDLMASVRYSTGCNKLIIMKTDIIEEFFDLSTKLAGEILQKFVNYDFSIAIVGDFSIYTSKSLKDFIYESNKGNRVHFVSSVDEAIEYLERQ